MMKKNTAKRVKAVSLAVAAAFLLCLTCTLAGMTKRAYSDWQANGYSVQERLYEAVFMFFAYAQMLTFAFVLLILCIRRLIRTVKQPKRPGRMMELIRQSRLYLAIGFACLFILLFLPDRAVRMRIANTAETSEVPAAIDDYMLCGKLEIGAELAAIGAVASFASWIRGKRESKHGQAEPPSVSSVSE